MQRRPLFWSLVSLICFASAVYVWHLADQWQAQKVAAQHQADSSLKPSASNTISHTFSPAATNKLSALATTSKTNRFAYRISNTTQSLNQLVHNEKGILLANALIDTGKPMDLSIPDRLRAPANNGTYIVQSRGPLDNQFRMVLQNGGATVVSYIPNNAYLVRMSDTAAQQIAGNPQTQSVLPYEPYYKLDAPLLRVAMENLPMPANNGLNVTVFPDAYQSTVQALKQLGANILSQDSSPFGPVLKVQPADNTLVDVAALPGVHQVAVSHTKKLANDLFRPTVGVAVDSVTSTNYLGLSGSNVLININDTGVDTNHPDFASGRITGDTTNATTDTEGHGTHVAGTILGNGSQSSTVTNAEGSVTNANFRGMATNATGFSMLFTSPDSYLQEQAAKTNALISNNSWYFSGDPVYDIAAASYDAAVRDALPEVPGSQSITYVFAAGNDGSGADDGSQGTADTIDSPGTAKNVITVGAIELPRFITNNAVIGGQTNAIFYGDTDSNDQVADFSSRGNVGPNIEGPAGRFKPDLIAPGTFVISDRSTVWNTTNYYNPTNFSFNSFVNQSIATNSFLLIPSVFIPPSTVEVIVTLTANASSSTPFPQLPIYVSTTGYLTNGTPVGSNSVSLPTNSIPVNPLSFLYFSVGNTTTSTVNFDVSVEFVITNDDGYFTALSNLNNGVAPWYRYESGTSMSAAGVSGMLACMQEFFQGRLGLTNSPALMKALLINGARSLDDYDLQVATGLNSQGWGLPTLPNIIPPALNSLTAGNLAANLGTMPLQFYDQSLTNALATGQSKTRNLVLGPGAQAQDMRITLVWTDPPGDPAAGVKLVNDLDLIVTNLDTGDIYYGNDIPAGNFYTEAFFPGGPTNIDSVNNVESVILQAPLGTNYSFTVYGHRVNVNAVTANTNDIVQDYALVVSSGDQGTATGLFTISETNNGAIVTNLPTNLTFVSNGVPLFNQRVGANSQFSGSTNGTAAQWNFYVFTNTAAATNHSFTNVAFLTFAPPNLGVPRMGASEEVSPPDTNATRYIGADIDLYVSTNPALTNLDTNVINQAFTNGMVSVTRTGTEKVLITNSSANVVYYIGVKSEDQQGAQYDFFGVATDQPFNQTDNNGNVLVTILTPFPVTIPPGGPGNPNHALILGVSTSTAVIRKTVVTNSLTDDEFGDLVGTLAQGTTQAVLNNHTFFTNSTVTNTTFVYDDSGENNIPGSKTSDGPGSLLNFTGNNASAGIWMFTMVNDSSLQHNGQINNFSIYLEPQPLTNGFSETILGNSWFYDFVDVPDNATNLTITVTSGRPIRLYVRKGDFPTTALYDESVQSSGGVASISINKFSSPPLNAGRYYYGVFNPNPNPLSVFITAEVDLSLMPVAVQNFLSVGFEPLLDDAVTYSTNTVGINSAVVSAEVGVRIDHPRESDLVLTLISPDGTRVLLAENRGGLDTNGYGSGVNVTNVLPSTSAGNVGASTNSILLGTNTFGTLIINYNFFTIPDDLRVYYAGTRIFDSGLISGPGTLSVDFGPGSATNIVILMNEAGSNPVSTNSSSDAWTYTATVVTKNISYATFSENTNYAKIPIKFAVPPFGSAVAVSAPATVMSNSFEGILATNYTGFVDGWTVTGTNHVTVVTAPNLAGLEGGGSNLLALHQETISRSLPTVAGDSYVLTFMSRGRPVLNPIGWWKGDGNTVDSSFVGNNAQFKTAGSPTFTSGVVSNAFKFTGNGLKVNDNPIYNLTNSLTIEGWIDPLQAGQSAAVFWRGDTRAGFDPYEFVVNPATHVSGAPTELDFAITSDDPATSYGNQVLLATPIQTNVFTYVAGTYNFDTNTGIGTLLLYVNGVQIGQLGATNRPLGDLIPAQGPAIGIGDVYDQHGFGIPFTGLVDEITLYSNALSASQIESIYAAGSAGKCDGNCTVTANFILGSSTNAPIIGADIWQTNIFAFTATSNNMVLTISAGTNADGSIQDGILLDNFKLVRNPVSNPTNYYLPEESLNKVIGQSSKGDWRLEVLDNRVGATNPQPMLVSWQLSLVLADQVSAAIPLSHAIPQTNTVFGNDIVYYLVNVPSWAQFATNILTTTGPLNLLFNQNIPPNTTNNSITLLSGGGTSVLTSNSTPLLLPGQSYYLGVQNTSTNPVSFQIEVDFDITTLTNAIPNTNNTIAAGSVPRYFQFDVDTNGIAVEFQLLNSTGSLELVAKKGPPLPDTLNFDYETGIPGPTNQDIIVFTNSVPVPLTPGRWYLGVFNNDIVPVTYTIVATETPLPNIIWLTNAIPTNYFSAPGPAFTNFFGFIITNSPGGALFELYKLSGNVDLTLQSNAFPYSAPFLGLSRNSGTNTEQIVIRTNATVTNLNGTYYLGVPNNDSTNVTYTIRASVSTNGLLISGIPIDITVTLPPTGSASGPTLSWPTVSGEMYEIQTSTNLLTWTTVLTNTAGGQTLTFTDTNAITGFPYLFYRVIQIP